MSRKTELEEKLEYLNSKYRPVITDLDMIGSLINNGELNKAEDLIDSIG